MRVSTHKNSSTTDATFVSTITATVAAAIDLHSAQKLIVELQFVARCHPINRFQSKHWNY